MISNKNTLVAVLGTLMLLALLPSCKDDTPRAKLLVTRFADNERVIYYEYDDNNLLRVMKNYDQAGENMLVVDSLFYNESEKVIRRTSKYLNVDANAHDIAYETTFAYIKDTIIIDQHFRNGSILSDTIWVNDENQIVADKYYHYTYDVKNNGHHMIEQIELNESPDGVDNELVKRFEYDKSISPLVHIKLDPWFIVNQLYLFEYAGANSPCKIFFETVEKKDGKVKVTSSDVEKVTFKYNKEKYPILMSGEDDLDGKWEIHFEYKEMK